MKILVQLNVLAMVAAMVTGFGGSEDKFLKKYAMMKIYESCFGPEVVKEIRKEMKQALVKCVALNIPPVAATTQPPPPPPVKDESEGLPTFDAEKLHQAILAYRPSAGQQASFYRPFAPAAPAASMSPFFNPAAFGAAAPYQNPLFYAGYPQQQFSPFAPFPMVGQQYYGNRVSRDMDRAPLEKLVNRLGGRMPNVTCVMQQLGYLDENLEPNYEKITERIEGLPVSDELKKDMQDGVTFCQQFSQCVPDVKKDRSPLSRELIKPMFFFKCYKHKKLEACIMQDVREKYTGVTEEDLDGDVELRRTSKSLNTPAADADIEAMASTMYEYLYGSESNVDFDGFL